MVFEDLQECGLTVNEPHRGEQLCTEWMNVATQPCFLLPGVAGYTSQGVINLSSIPYRTLTPKHLILLLKELLKLCWWLGALAQVS